MGFKILSQILIRFCKCRELSYHDSLACSLYHPGKSFGLKFIPNQSDLFRNLFPRQSELIRVNPKKIFNLV